MHIQLSYLPLNQCVVAYMHRNIHVIIAGSPLIGTLCSGFTRNAGQCTRTCVNWHAPVLEEGPLSALVVRFSLRYINGPSQLFTGRYCYHHLHVCIRGINACMLFRQWGTPAHGNINLCFSRRAIEQLGSACLVPSHFVYMYIHFIYITSLPSTCVDGNETHGPSRKILLYRCIEAGLASGTHFPH